MAKITNILVPIDGTKASDTGLRMAVTLASQFGAALTGVHVLKADSHSEFSTKPSVSEYDKKESEKIMENARKMAAAKGVTIKEKVVTGDPGYNITKLANDKKRGFNLVVLGSRGRGNLKRLFMGSVSNYIIQSSKIPVMIAK